MRPHASRQRSWCSNAQSGYASISCDPARQNRLTQNCWWMGDMVTRRDSERSLQKTKCTRNWDLKRNGQPLQLRVLMAKLLVVELSEGRSCRRHLDSILRRREPGSLGASGSGKHPSRKPSRRYNCGKEVPEGWGRTGGANCCSFFEWECRKRTTYTPQKVKTAWRDISGCLVREVPTDNLPLTT